ncbi:hypothetical protein KC360_g4218 [Hortaea werneckii]|nr:hypothetical protein KC325_g4293 [Hortaea werneckii]KAI6993855.1 hypothetical protein KC359_g4922 [Hortaea werneckii]KAI7145775.1 hypothetical protein KC344_g4199 [Hortaea werneckii]KAI7174534.1 hypothetical protein KC360_g4218 [Hortaea werneckii]
MEGDNAHERPSATHSSVEKIDDPADSVAIMSEDIAKMTIQQTQQSQDESIIREQIALAVGSESAALFELRHTVDRGYGLFAATDIQRGTCIFKEAPLVLITRWRSHDPKTMDDISEKLYELSPNQRRAYRLLHKEVDDDYSMTFRTMKDRLAGMKTKSDQASRLERLLDDFAIFKTNGVQAGIGGRHGHAVFLTYSRLNHSCSPNAHHAYNAPEGLEMLHATRDITAGEEITITYINLLLTPRQRAAELQQWGFACACKSCKGAGASASKARRQRMFDIDQAIAFHQCTDPIMRALSQPKYTLPQHITGKLSWAEELVRLCGEEGLIVDQMNAYHELSTRFLELGDLDRAFETAGKELELQRVCYGNDFKPDNDAATWIAELQGRLDQRREAAALVAEQRLHEEKYKAQKAAYQEGKKAWAADKKVNKKAKRAIKVAAEKAGFTTEDAEALLAGIDAEKLTVVAEKLKGENDPEKVKFIIAELSSITLRSFPKAMSFDNEHTLNRTEPTFDNSDTLDNSKYDKQYKLKHGKLIAFNSNIFVDNDLYELFSQMPPLDPTVQHQEEELLLQASPNRHHRAIQIASYPYQYASTIMPITPAGLPSQMSPPTQGHLFPSPNDLSSAFESPSFRESSPVIRGTSLGHGNGGRYNATGSGLGEKFQCEDCLKHGNTKMYNRTANCGPSRCRKHQKKFMKDLDAQMTPIYELDESIVSYEEARQSKFPSVKALVYDGPGLDDWQLFVDQGGYWTHRFIQAANVPYTEANPFMPTDNMNNDEKAMHLHLIKQQQTYNHKPHEETSKAIYTTRSVTSSLWILFQAILNFHRGGEAVYPIGGANGGYGDEKRLKMSARLLEIEGILRKDKRVLMDVIEGRGVLAFAAHPVAYQARKQSNKTCNDRKKRKFDKAELYDEEHKQGIEEAKTAVLRKGKRNGRRAKALSLDPPEVSSEGLVALGEGREGEEQSEDPFRDFAEHVGLN